MEEKMSKQTIAEKVRTHILEEFNKRKSSERHYSDKEECTLIGNTLGFFGLMSDKEFKERFLK